MLRSPHQNRILAQQTVKGARYVDVTFDELPVVVAETEKTTNIRDIRRHRPVTYSLYLLGIRFHTCCADNMSEIRDFLLK